jgi:NUDIX domain
MTWEPQKFFIGMMEFFTIILPGAVFVLVFMDFMPSQLLGLPDTGWESVGAFLVASYLFGHFAYLIGAMLDDVVYDGMRSRSLGKYMTWLSEGHKAPTRTWTWWQQVCMQRDVDIPLSVVIRIKNRMLGPLHASDAINAFQWTKSWLGKNCPDMLADVDRLEADSKFFRSFVVVLFLIVLKWTVEIQHWPVVLAAVVLFVLSLFRYLEQRHKMIFQAYCNLITVFSQQEGFVLDEPPNDPPGHSYTHSGGVVCRTSRGFAEYLLVSASDNPGQWVLPKGKLRPGEKLKRAAVREIYEEAGIWASPQGDPLPDRRGTVHCAYFAMH